MNEPWSEVLKKLNLTVTTVRPAQVAVDVLSGLCKLCPPTAPAADSDNDGSSRGGNVAGEAVDDQVD